MKSLNIFGITDGKVYAYHTEHIQHSFLVYRYVKHTHTLLALPSVKIAEMVYFYNLITLDYILYV